MKVSVEKLTPRLAIEYLKRNVQNRKVKRAQVDLLADLMTKGKWQENGEPLIFDSKGVLKNGQHRLQAVIKSGHSYDCVVVRGVEPEVMETIDTGENRKLPDVLYLHGYKDVNVMAALVRMAIRYNWSKGKNSLENKVVRNPVGLEYVRKHEQRLYSYTKHTGKIYKKSPRIIPQSYLNMVLHIITKSRPAHRDHLEFLKQLAGVNVVEGSGCAWYLGLLRKAKKDKVRYLEYWRIGITIKLWNIYVQGNAPVRYVKFDATEKWPEVL